MIGRAWSVKRLVPFKSNVTPYENGKTLWVSGNGYNYGMMPPRYPMPAIIYQVNESFELWEYVGQPDNIRSSYPTYYRKVK